MRLIPLKELAKVDISNVDKKTKEGETEVILCNFVDVYHNWAITKELAPALMRSTANRNQIERFSIHKGQVAITKDSETRDDIGIPTYIADDIENGVLGYHCALITPNEAKLKGKYLNIVLHSPYAKKYFEANASGSGQRYTLTNDIIENFPVPMPEDVSIQDKLGRFCSAIDSKISNNTSICSELESMAKLLYDYWFVQFDFPDENGRPYKSSGGKMVWNEELKREIPERWEVKELSHYCSFENGDRGNNYPSGDDFVPEGIPFVAGGALKEHEIDCNELRYISEEKYHSLRAGKASRGDILMTLRGSLAKCVYSPFEKMAIASALVITRPKNGVSREYLHRVLISDHYVQLLKNYDNGSVQANLSVDTIKSFPMLFPGKTVMDLFTRNIELLEEKEATLRDESQQLASLRDFLLPMLMNGQVKVGKGV